VEKHITLPSGVGLEYVEQGRPEGIPVVFLPGVTDSWRSFERLLPLLPPSVRAFAISQRGHGGSSRPDTEYRFTEFSDDLHAFMNALELPQAIIVGHSMGASVTQRFVVDHPERVRAVALMGAFASFDDPGLAEFVSSSVLTLEDPVPEPFVREWQMSTLARPMDPSHFEIVVRETLKVPARIWHAAFKGFLATPDFSEQLRTISVPALVLWGEQDTYAHRAAQDRLVNVMTGSTLVTYAGYGHAFHWEDPDMVVADLMKFVERVVLSGRS
jgi:non-heme chloroperoxidase